MKKCKCGNKIQKRSKKCKECVKITHKMTLKELKEKVKYQTHARIRQLARKVYQKSQKPKECAICGYNLHYDIAHKKDISLFDDNATAEEINQIDNLIALCKNHHWEFDHGHLSIEGCFPKKKPKPRKNKCPKCSDLKLFDSKLCIKCSNKCGSHKSRKFKIKWPSARILKKMVEETSYRQTAKKLGVSDKAVKNHMIKMGVI